MYGMENMKINIALKHYISFSRSFTIFHCRTLRQVLILSLHPSNLSGPLCFFTVCTKLAIIMFGYYVMTQISCKFV
jgi:hypothetical protein